MNTDYDFAVEEFNLPAEFESDEADWQGEVNRSSRDYIKWVQQSLNRSLGLRLTVDGISGTQTRSAVRSFQQQRGLAVDGIVGPQTEQALIAAGAGSPPGSSTAGVGAGRPPSYIPAVAPKSGTPPGSHIPQRKNCETLDNFSFDRDTLTPAHQAKLAALAKRIVASQSTSRPIHALQITGHTDPVGSPEYNLALGQRRAERVSFALAEELERNRPGIGNTLSLNVQSRGEAEPISTTDMTKNRRVEVCLQTTPAKPQPPGRGRGYARWFETGGTPPMQPVRAGNAVLPLIDGLDTFKEMVRIIRTARSAGHYIYLLGWWLSNNFELVPGDPDSTILSLFRNASTQGVQVRVMLWDQYGTQNSAEVDHINNWLSNGAAILDNRTLQTGFGSHHQKILIVKGADGLTAFCGGIDINPDRIPPPTGSTRGAPLHDVHCRITGPAAYDVLRIFLDRWQDHPGHAVLDSSKGTLRGLSEQLPPPAGNVYVQIGRTYGNGVGHRFAPNGEQTCRRMILKAIREARRFIYIEDQYLVSVEIRQALLAALPNIQHLTILIPHGSITAMPQVHFRRQQVIAPLRAAGGSKVA
jgi:phosphatidylserine/phosphatidylglycerophosphate/cardiolipin synthase-like enzyme/outer membrane protein OmpA-like peptidoglycan-associated protein